MATNKEINIPISLTLLAGVLSLITLFANESQDMAIYIDYYKISCEFDYQEYFLQISKEPLFTMGIYLFGKITSCDNPIFYRFFLTFIALWLVGVGIYNLCIQFADKKDSFIITLSTLIFPILIEGSSHIVRELMAIGVCLILIRSFSMVKFVAALGLHLTSLISLPLLFYQNNLKNFISSMCYFFLFLSTLLIFKYPDNLLERMYSRLISLSQSLGDVELNGLSLISYVIWIFSLLLAVSLVLYFCNKSKPKETIAKRILLYIILVFVVIFISLIYDYKEMQERMIYYLYPLFFMLVGIHISSFKKVKYTFWLLQSFLFGCVYIYRNF